MLRCGNDVSMAKGGRVGGERLMAQFLDSKIAGDRYSLSLLFIFIIIIS